MDDTGLDGDEELTILSRSELADRVRQRTADLENLMDTMVDVLLKLGPDGRIKLANEAVRDMLGYEPDELEGKPIDHILAGPDRNEELASMLRSGELVELLLRERSATDLESALETADGEAVPTSFSASVMTDDGTVEGIVCVATDTTERTQAKERAEFLHSVLRHDLGNKLTVIDGYIDLLAETELTDEQQEYLSYAENGVTEAIDLVENVRTLHQLDADEDLQPVSLSTVVRETVDRHADLADRRGVTVETDDVGEQRVRAGSLLKELVSNLLENALVHSDGSTIRIETTDRGSSVGLAVEDDGEGIPPRKRDRLLERGETAGSSGGTGLGTYLAAEIAESYGGELTVEDAELGGARFAVRLQKAA